MIKRIATQIFVIILLSLLPGICFAQGNEIVITSFYTGIVVSFTVFLAGMLVSGYIFNFLRKEKSKSNILFPYGLYWFFCGVTALLFALASYMHAILGVRSYLIDIITYHVMMGHAFSITYHMIYKNFYKKSIAWAGTIFIMLFGVVYSIMLIAGQWRGTIESDWGAVALTPASAKYMSLIFSGIFMTVVFADFLIRLYRAIKRKDRSSWYEFAIDFPVVIFYFAGMLQMNDLPGWRLVLDRTFMLIAMLIAFTLIYQTQGLPYLLAKEKKMNK